MKLTVIMLMLCLTGCAAVPLATTAAGYFTSGGVTLYKSAKESGPKVEVVLIKIEVNHYQVQYTPEGFKK